MSRVVWLMTMWSLVVVSGCRTSLKPLRKGPESQTYVAPHQCDVFDYPAATDVPEGASNLGWVSVKKEEEEADELTFIRLRQKICEMGGNALSQPAWVRDTDEVEPRILKANAWLLP